MPAGVVIDPGAGPGVGKRFPHGSSSLNRSLSSGRMRVLCAMQHYSATCEAVTTRAPARGAGSCKNHGGQPSHRVLRLSSGSWLQAPSSPELICCSRWA
jgi:hypothetical protein